MKLLGNLLWLVLGGLLIAVIYFLVGLLMCITIIGIPFGIACFRIAKVSFAPIGKKVIDK